MFPYTAQNADELTFYKGSVINVLSKDGEWWKGEMNGLTGMFPSNYVQPLSDVKVGTTQCKYVHCCKTLLLRVTLRLPYVPCTSATQAGLAAKRGMGDWLIGKQALNETRCLTASEIREL